MIPTCGLFTNTNPLPNSCGSIAWTGGTVPSGTTVPRRNRRSPTIWSRLAHLSRCQQLVRAGYRPATIAVVEMSRGQPLVTASVWHRPVVGTKDRVELARRRANAAIGLMRLGKTEQVWELLRQQTEPDVRTYLIDRLGPLGADPRSLISRLETESDVWVRRALLLSLGEFRADQLRSVPADQRNRLASLMQRWYRDDPDPGIHAALAWLSRPGETGRIRPKLDWGLRAALEAADRELTSKALACSVCRSLKARGAAGLAIGAGPAVRARPILSLTVGPRGGTALVCQRPGADLSTFPRPGSIHDGFSRLRTG